MKYPANTSCRLLTAALICLMTATSCLGQMDRAGNNTADETGGNASIDQEAYEIGLEAYIYFYPLVTMDITLKQMTNFEKPGESGVGGPMNTFAHSRIFPPTEFKTVVRPNFDTLYSSAWLNLTSGPVILSVPDTGGRYYLLQMMDMWTDVFASPGKRTTGTGAGDFAIVPQCWNGTLPEGLERIDSPTPWVWIIGRTQTNGESDYEAVHEVQDGFKITPLSSWGKGQEPVLGNVDPSLDMETPPLYLVNSMPAATYFAYAADLLAANPPHITDQPIVDRMKRIGIEPGKSFDFQKLDPSVREALEKAALDGLKEMNQKGPTLAKAVNGWQMNIDTMGVYGTYYLKRAIIAMTGLGANLPEDAIYPILVKDADGNAPDGNNSYLLHFNQSELPPVNAFWSITMYDADGFPVVNSLDRHAIGDRDPLKYNEDGSLDIYIQNQTPGAEMEANWLPAPRGPLSITMRLYSPAREVQEGIWSPPAVRRAS